VFADIHTIFNSMLASGEERGGFPGMPDTEATMLAFSRAHPLAATWLDRPFEELLDRHAIDPAARRIVLALSGYISDGTDILTCGQMVPIFGYYFHGGFYPVGGSQKLADVLLEAIEARGGVVRLRTPVAQILVEDGRAAGVRLADGTQLRTRAVVSNADAQLTFLELLQPGELPDGFRARVAAARPANSAFMVHLGVDFVPDIRPAVHDDADLPIGIETLSLLDPSAAPAGHATIGIFTLLRHDEAQKWFPGQPCEHEPDEAWKSWRQSSEYQARKQALGNRMVAAAEHAIPGLTAHIVHRSDASPVTYARYDRASSGAIYGLSGAPILRGAKSPIPGLVVAGTTMFGPGVEAVLLAGACAAEALVPNLLRRIPLGQSSATGLESCVSTGGINARRGKSVPAWT